VGCIVKAACPVCECDPCDCGWGTYISEKGNPCRIYISPNCWWEHDGDDLATPFGSTWDYCDADLEYPQKLQGDGEFAKSYFNKMSLMFAIGDPVRYFPNANLANDGGVWVVKDIVNRSLIECSWYDYEITNGIKTVMCREEELFQLR